MKKIIIFCTTLLMFNSCIKHANIYRLLSDEDAASIPYVLGQTVSFINQDGDTLAYEVTSDVTYPYNYDQYLNAINGGDVDHPAPNSIECYARTVMLTLDGEPYANRLCFTVRPPKEFTFTYNFGEQEIYLEGSLYTNDTYNIDGIEYEHVHHQILYTQYTGELMYDFYYSQELGLLLFKKGNISLTRIP